MDSSRSRKQEIAYSLGEKLFLKTVSAEAKYDGESRQESKTGALVYTLCCFTPTQASNYEILDCGCR